MVISAWDVGYQPPRMPKYSAPRYSVGVDLGQANDPTAIAVLEKTIAPPETAMFSPVGEHAGNRLVEGSTVFDLVYLKRPKLGKVNISTGNLAFEPWRESEHDDLLFATCLALWGWQVKRRGTTKLRIIR